MPTSCSWLATSCPERACIPGARLIRHLTTPVWTQHSWNEKFLKGGKQSAQWYLEAAKGAWVKPLIETCSLLQDMHSLAYLGFGCTFADVFPGMTTSHSSVCVQDNLAQSCSDLVLSVLHFRGQHVVAHRLLAWLVGIAMQPGPLGSPSLCRAPQQ